MGEDMVDRARLAPVGLDRRLFDITTLLRERRDDIVELAQYFLERHRGMRALLELETYATTTWTKA